jgi:hypothetical protein
MPAMPWEGDTPFVRADDVVTLSIRRDDAEYLLSCCPEPRLLNDPQRALREALEEALD